jgi:hydrogenase small subunit
MISLDYDDTIMAAAGHQAEAALEQTMKDYKGQYILAVEGNPPLGEDGMYCMPGGKPFLDKLKHVAKDAKAIIAWGSCASWGCVQAAKPNPTTAVPINKVITDKPIIKVPGCPPIPEVMTAVVTYVATFDRIPELDRQGRPKMFYSQRIHDSAIAGRTSTPASSSRRGRRRRQARLLPLQDGLQGADDVQRLLDHALERGHVVPDWLRPHGCIGCSEDGFWDKGSFYDRLTTIREFGVEANADKVGLAAAGVVGAGLVAHAAVTAIRRAADRTKTDADTSKRVEH